MNDSDHTFTDLQQESFERLHARYSEDRDQFSTRERAYLGFVRWLWESGRIPGGTPTDDTGKIEYIAPLEDAAQSWGLFT